MRDHEIAQLTNGAMTAWPGADEISGAQHLSMCVRDRPAATNEAHARQIVHVVTDIDDLRWRDLPFRKMFPEKRRLVRNPLGAREPQLAATRRDDRMRLRRTHKHLNT